MIEAPFHVLSLEEYKGGSRTSEFDRVKGNKRRQVEIDDNTDKNKVSVISTAPNDELLAMRDINNED